MKPGAHLVAYKDKCGEPILYFGPFVSPSIAQFFKAEMPEPLEGGYCKTVALQPFTIHEGHVVHEKIIRERQK